MRMQDAVKLGKSFLEWLAEQAPKPTKSEIAVLQIRFEQTQDLMKDQRLLDAVSHPSEKAHSREQFVVVQANGWPMKQHQKSVPVHSNRANAEQFAKQHLDEYEIRTKIIPYLVFTHTAQGKFCARLQKSHALMQSILARRKQKVIAIIKPKSKISKGAQDSIKHLEGLLIKAQVKCNLTEIVRLKAKIKKLKGTKQ